MTNVQQTDLFCQKPTVRELYDMWKEENPLIIAQFNLWADFAAKRGKRFGGWLIWNRLRWDVDIESNGDEFKCNNNWIAHLTRDWQKSRPHWAHLVNIRELKS